MKHLTHNVDICVIGGGLSGLCAAVAAARRGAKVLLLQDRPVLGGNASSEIRMWVRGAHGANNRETGIIEEIELENLHRNAAANYPIWDSVLFEKARFQANLALLLNCACCEAAMDGTRIRSVKAYQSTAETWHTVAAQYFIDCSGDSVLAPLTGAQFRVGREARAEFNEDIEPEQADLRTMGLSCLIQARETGRPQPFVPPAWAHVYTSDEDLPHRGHDVRGKFTNFWWMEIGGEFDSIHDTESLRDELLKIAFGVWDHVKNRGDHGADNWVLDWVGFLPGKRESRRYVGDHILTQNDVRAEGRFDDLIAYGGWSMDDHHPAGIRFPGEPTIFHPAPSPYGIPYRSLYSRNIGNLLFAGRNISTTHAALSSTRVMATCSIIGQAAGTAAGIAAQHGVTPRGVYEKHLRELQQALMDDDCYLPWQKRDIPRLTAEATVASSGGNADALRNGIDRPVGNESHAWTTRLGGWAEYRFEKEVNISGVRLVFDSDLNRDRRMGMTAMYPLDLPALCPPPSLVKEFTIDAQASDGSWGTVLRHKGNYQRLVRLSLDVTATALRLSPKSSWGNDVVNVFAWEVK
ncbi:FAD-dependent oxidoreductase [bacterium]|nr:FAD-dependent oxidoreductase [bacterium]